MELQKDSLAECLETMTGQPKGQGHKEVELALERLFFWAAYCDKYGGSVQVGMIWGHKFCLPPFLHSSGKILSHRYHVPAQTDHFVWLAADTL